MVVLWVLNGTKIAEMVSSNMAGWKILDEMEVLIGTSRIHGGLIFIYHLLIEQFASENGHHRNSEFSHQWHDDCP